MVSELGLGAGGLLSPDVLLEHRADPTLKDILMKRTARKWAEGSSVRGHAPPGTKRCYCR